MCMPSNAPQPSMLCGCISCRVGERITLASWDSKRWLKTEAQQPQMDANRAEQEWAGFWQLNSDANRPPMAAADEWSMRKRCMGAANFPPALQRLLQPHRSLLHWLGLLLC